LSYLPPLRAVATALYGNTPLELATTVVQGTTKADLAVDHSIPATHRRIGPGGDFTIQSSIAELLLVVQGVVQMQRASGETRPVPLVYGSAIETNCRPAVEAIIAEHRGELGMLVNLEDPRCA
jgi:hypothetical protein